MDQYDVRTGTLAREVGVSATTIGRYAQAGILDFKLASDGTRLFRRGQAELLRRQIAAAQRKRGKYPRAPERL